MKFQSLNFGLFKYVLFFNEISNMKLIKKSYKLKILTVIANYELSSRIWFLTKHNTREKFFSSRGSPVNSDIFCSLLSIFLLIFFGLREFSFWSDSFNFMEHNSWSSFTSQSSFCKSIFFCLSISWSETTSRRHVFKVYHPLN